MWGTLSTKPSWTLSHGLSNFFKGPLAWLPSLPQQHWKQPSSSFCFLADTDGEGSLQPPRKSTNKQLKSWWRQQKSALGKGRESSGRLTTALWGGLSSLKVKQDLTTETAFGAGHSAWATLLPQLGDEQKCPFSQGRLRKASTDAG